jgi:hypothetical protein
MNRTSLTLRKLFGVDRLELSAESAGQLASRETYAELQEQLKDKAGSAWASIARRLPEQLETLLDIDAVEVMVGAWNKSRELRKYRNEAEYPPEQLVLVPLAKHKIESKHAPYVELFVNAQPCGRLNFEIDVSLTLEGAELAIQGGRIKRIRTGSTIGTGTIKCEGAVLGKGERKLLPLPGEIDLGQGVVIPA